MMEIIKFISQDAQHFIGTLIFVGVVGTVLVEIVEALKK